MKTDHVQTIRAGLKVMVFGNWLTGENPEGIATIRKVIGDSNAIVGGDYRAWDCMVHFDEDDPADPCYRRTILGTVLGIREQGE